MDHYKCLGVHQTASKDEIKKAYRQLAKRYHPDKNSASNAEAKFRSLNEAYEVLIDDNKRQNYDRFDLPQAKANQARQTHHSSYKRPRADERFFTGSSERHSERQRYQDELDRVRGINSDLLVKANAELRRTSGAPQPSGQSSQRSRVFMDEIHPDKNDEEYEKIVISRLQSCRAES